MSRRDTVQFWYMNKFEMYSGSKREIVEKQFIGIEKPAQEETETDFGYITNGKDIAVRKRIRDELYGKFTRPVDMALAFKGKRFFVEVIYVKHFGTKDRVEYGLLNEFLALVGDLYTFRHPSAPKTILPVPWFASPAPVNGEEWIISAKPQTQWEQKMHLEGKWKEGQSLSLMIIVTGDHYEIAIASGTKSHGMQQLYSLVPGANVVMGSGDSANDIALQDFVTGKGGAFVAVPTRQHIKAFSERVVEGAKQLPAIQVEPFFHHKAFVPGLWFFLLQAWNMCPP